MCKHFLDEILPIWGTCKYQGGCVIAAAFPYRLPEEYYAGRNVARFAVVRDYHDICGARLERACMRLKELHPEGAFEWSWNRANRLPEIELAQKTGLGHRGRHNLLITPAYGSWVFLGAIKSSIRIQDAERRGTHFNPCAECAGYCVKACPTGALGEDGNRERCVSRVSQRKRELSPEEAALLRQAGSAWGCDICQEACPHNQKSKIDPLPEFLVAPIARVTLDTPMENRAWAWRGKAIIERNLKSMLDF